MTETASCRNCGARLNDPESTGTLCPACMMRGFLDADLMGREVEAGQELPRRFGDYELLEEIGHGGMGVVYRARQRALDRVVAVKLLLAGRYSSEAALQRFHREASAAAVLNHPNIVAIHDFGEVDGRSYYAMDYVAGRSLTEVCDGRPLAHGRAARITQYLADAMRHAHEHGVLHRDLKPSNVIVDAEDRPHITDFGLAKFLESTDGATLSGQVMGSPGYMAPEQALGRKTEIGVAVDAYGLGALLYQLLTGRAPFNAATPVETLRLVLESSPASPWLLNPALPRDLVTICLKCLAKEPAQRYASAAEVGEDLERFLHHRPIRARPPSIVYRARKFVRRYRTGVIAVAVVFVTLLAGLVATFVSYRHAVAQQRATDAARARSEEMVNFIMQKSLPHQQALGRRQAMVESAETAVRYFEQLPAELRTRETVRAHATALDLLVQAYGYGRSRTSTDPENSRKAAEQAAALWRQLAESDPTDVDAMAAALFAEWVVASGDHPASSGHERGAIAEDLLERYRELENRHPEHEAVQVGIARLLRYPSIFRGRGDAEEAVARRRESLQRFDCLLAAKPGDASLRFDRAGSWNALGFAHAECGDVETAMRCWEEAMAMANGLLAEDATNMEFLGLAATIGMSLVWREPAENRRAERVQVVRRYLETLMALDPEDPDWRLWDARALQLQARPFIDDRKPREALRAIKAALTRFKSMPPDSYDPKFGESVGQAGFYAVQAEDGVTAAAMLQWLQGEFMDWAQTGNSPYQRSSRRFHCLYWQSQIVGARRDWTELERLARDMLVEAGKRRVDAPDTALLESIYRAGAEAILGKALMGQGRGAEAVPLLVEAVRRFQDNPSRAPFYEYWFYDKWEAAENLAGALQPTGDRQRMVELLEWAFEKRDAHVRKGGLLESRVQLAQCAWQLAQTLDPDNPAQAARRLEVLARARELLDDPETAPRLTAEEQELRVQVAACLGG